MDKRAEIIAEIQESRIIPQSEMSSIRPRAHDRASCIWDSEDIFDLYDRVRPSKDGVYLHIVAVNAGEAWGGNSWGDYFPEAGLLGENPTPSIMEQVKDMQSLIPSMFGYTTFVNGSAFVYLHHDNTSPSKSVGTIEYAIYNRKIRRVELIIFVREADAAEYVAKVRKGDRLAFSMGCHVPFDRCSVCQHLARSRAEYCDHLKHRMGQIVGGVMAYAINDFPVFFDISIVTTPADKSAYQLRKVASTEAPRMISLPPELSSALCPLSTLKEMAPGMAMPKLIIHAVRSGIIPHPMPEIPDLSNILRDVMELGESPFRHSDIARLSLHSPYALHPAIQSMPEGDARRLHITINIVNPSLAPCDHFDGEPTRARKMREWLSTFT